jgi:UDP-sugar transporter A1/2/3
MSELLKVGACLAVIWYEQGRTLGGCYSHLNENIFQQPLDCVRISVPAFVYMIQNNLIYVAASNLDAATFQVTYQLKILTTAVLSVVMLRKHLTRLQWVSLFLLFIGVAAVNIQANSPMPAVTKKAINSMSNILSVTVKPKVAVTQRPIIGFIAVLSACILSGFAGVYFEKILKSTPQSIYIRNVQLGVIGGILGVIAVYISDGAKVSAHGFFYGYDMAVWSVIMLHAFGGIVVAVVVKYADNIVKGFAASAAIIISCVVSMYIFDFELSALFLFGATLVIISTYMYSRFVPASSSTSKPNPGIGTSGGMSATHTPVIKLV